MDNKRQPLIVALGELLWDHLPTGFVLGGAPANFAFHVARLGGQACLLSRVGADELGESALRALGRAGIDVTRVQVDRQRPTGIVDVQFDGGEPRYVIAEDSAWDHLTFVPEHIALLARADLVCLGSLAWRRQEQARAALDLLDALRAAPKRPRIVLDLNLRPPFWEPTTLLSLVARADVLKVNALEWATLAELLTHPPEQLLTSGDLEILIVTRGARGASVQLADESHDRPALPVSGGDPVGAGDAFLAGFSLALTRGEPPATALERAILEGSRIAAQVGAMPGLEPRN